MIVSPIAQRKRADRAVAAACGIRCANASAADRCRASRPIDGLPVRIASPDDARSRRVPRKARRRERTRLPRPHARPAGWTCARRARRSRSRRSVYRPSSTSTRHIDSSSPCSSAARSSARWPARSVRSTRLLRASALASITTRRASRSCCSSAGAISTPARCRAACERFAPLARKPHALVVEHCRDQRLDALEVRRAARERIRIDDEERLADARAVAFVDEERARLESHRRAGQRRDEQLDDEREHRALRAAHREHRPLQARPSRRSSAGRRASSAQPSGIGRPSFAATITLPRATSDSERSIVNGGAASRGKTAAIGLVPNSARLPPAAGIAAGELPKREPDHPRLRDRCEVPRRDAEMMAVGDAGERRRRIRARAPHRLARRRARTPGNASPQRASTSTAPPPLAHDDGATALPSARPLRRCVAYCATRAEAVRREALRLGVARARRRSSCAIARDRAGALQRAHASSRSAGASIVVIASQPSAASASGDFLRDQRRHALVRLRASRRRCAASGSGCGQPASGDPGAERLVLEHVERRAAEPARAQRRGDAPPRRRCRRAPLLISIASCFIVAMRAASIRLRVAGVSGTCSADDVGASRPARRA